MKIGILGAGRVGCSIGKFLEQNASDCQIVGYYSKTYEHTVEAANFTNSKAFTDCNALLKESDTLFIATPDSEIALAWDCIDKTLLQNKLIGHFSGSLSSDVFVDILNTGAFPGSVHPMYAFSDRFLSHLQLHTAIFTCEGHPSFVAPISTLFTSCGLRVCEIEKDKKALYHAAASMASNHMLGLLETSLSLLEEAGFERNLSYSVLSSLMKHNLDLALSDGVESALTGPIERNDIDTVQKHLTILNENDQKLYKLLGKKIVTIAKRKHPQKDYCDIERILEP